MSLLGYINTGKNQSLTGICSITDGEGTIISEGKITTENLDILGPISSTSTITAYNLNCSTLFTLTGNLLVNSVTLTPLILSYLSGLTSNVQSQINTSNSATTNISYSSGLTTYTGLNYFQLSSLTFPTTSTGTKSGLSLYWNASGGQGEVDYLCYGQGGNAGHYFYTSNHTTAPALCLSITNSMTTIPSTQILALLGTLYVNSISITPTQLSYLSGLSSNIQTQINTLTTNTSTNTSNITSNTSNIATNTSNITTNTSNITTNTSNIATNTSNITALQTATTAINTNIANYTVTSGTQYFNLGGYAIPSTTTGTNAGFYMGWNKSGGRGETDFLACGQTSGSGFNFYVANSTITPTLICSMLYSSFTIPSIVPFVLNSYLDLTSSSGIKASSSVTVSPTALSYLDASSSIQTQFNTITSNVATNTSNISTNTSNISTNTSNISTLTSTVSTLSATVSSMVSTSSANTWTNQNTFDGYPINTTTLPTFTDHSIGYTIKQHDNTLYSITTGIYSYYNPISLPVGVNMITGTACVYCDVVASYSFELYIAFLSGTTSASESGTISYQNNVPAYQLIQQTTSLIQSNNAITQYIWIKIDSTTASSHFHLYYNSISSVKIA